MRLIEPELARPATGRGYVRPTRLVVHRHSRLAAHSGSRRRQGRSRKVRDIITPSPLPPFPFIESYIALNAALFLGLSYFDQLFSITEFFASRPLTALERLLPHFVSALLRKPAGGCPVIVTSNTATSSGAQVIGRISVFTSSHS